MELFLLEMVLCDYLQSSSGKGVTMLSMFAEYTERVQLYEYYSSFVHSSQLLLSFRLLSDRELANPVD